LILANSETAVAEVDGLIYVVGGYPSSREISNAVQAYLPEDDRWRLAIPLPVPTHHAMAAAVNGKLYIFGGEASDSGFASRGGPAGGQLGGDGAFGGGFGGGAGGFGGAGGRRGFGGGGFAGGTFGTVLAIENGTITITITTQAGDVAIQIAADTTFQYPLAMDRHPQQEPRMIWNWAGLWRFRALKPQMARSLLNPSLSCRLADLVVALGIWWRRLW
jgi:hypothetical protein